MLVRSEVLTQTDRGNVEFLQLHHRRHFPNVFGSVMSSESALFPTVRGRVVCMFVSVHYCSRTGAACRRATSSRVVVASYTMRERSVVKSRLRSAAARLRHRRPERASAALRALGRIMWIDTGYYVIIWEHVNWQLSFFASHEPLQSFLQEKALQRWKFSNKIFWWISMFLKFLSQNSRV